MNIGELKATLPRKARGANLDDIQGVTDFSIFKEAAGNLLRKIDPIRTRRSQLIQLYPGVQDYSPPTDLRGKKVIAINRQGRRFNDKFHQVYADDIDQDSDMAYGIAYANNQKLLRIETDLGGATSVDETDSDDNWAVSGTAGSLEEERLIIPQGGLRFDVTTGSGLLTWNGDETIDLSDGEQLGAFFRELYIPDATKFTSITMRIGNSVTGYWEIVGVPAFGTTFVTGLNLVKFDWNGSAPNGGALSNVIDYQRLEVVMSASDTDLVIGPLMFSIPTPYEITYYSSCLFIDSTGVTFKEKPDSDDDIVLLEVDEEPAIIYETSQLIAEDMQRDGRSQKFKGKLNGESNIPGVYSDVKAQKPSEAKRMTHRWYRPINFHSRGAARRVRD